MLKGIITRKSLKRVSFFSISFAIRVGGLVQDKGLFTLYYFPRSIEFNLMII